MARRAWVSAVLSLAAEPDGVVYLDVFTPTRAADLAAAARGGDAAARQLLGGFDTITRGIEKARERPRLCVSCARPLHNNRFCIVIATPARFDPARAFGIGICQRCGRTEREVFSCAAAVVQRLWPNLQPTRHTSGGRA